MKLFLYFLLIFSTLISCKSAEIIPAVTTKSKSSSKEVLSLSVKDVTTASVKFNQSTNSYSIDVPFGTNIKSIALSFTLSAGATSNPLSQSIQDFTNPVNYTVTAEDGTKLVYKVTVNILPQPIIKSSQKNILDFQLTDFTPPLSGRIFELGGINSILFHYNPKESSSFVPGEGHKTKITISPNAKVSPESLVRTRFTDPVPPIYTVTAEDGTTKTYTAKLTNVEKYLPSNDLKYIISTNKNYIFIADPESGLTIWEYKCDSELSAPTSDGNYFYANSQTQLYIFDLTTLKLIGNSKYDTNPSGAAIVIDKSKNSIYSLTADGVYYFTKTGSRIWKYNYNNSSNIKLYGMGAVAGNLLFSFFHDKLNEVYKLVAINTSNGTKVWEFESKYQLTSATTNYNNKIFVTTSWKNLYSLETSTGKKVWEYIEPSSYPNFSGSTIYNGILYIGAGNNKLIALDESNGNLKWSYPTENYVTFSPVISNGKLYVNINKLSSVGGASNKGAIIHTINPVTGAKINTTNFFSMGQGINNNTNNLVVYNNIIFLAITRFKYYPIDVSDYKFCYSGIEGNTPCLITKTGNVITYLSGTIN
jgi:outer membrane protein assembly factor BamB